MCVSKQEKTFNMNSRTGNQKTPMSEEYDLDENKIGKLNK